MTYIAGMGIFYTAWVVSIQASINYWCRFGEEAMRRR